MHGRLTSVFTPWFAPPMLGVSFWKMIAVSSAVARTVPSGRMSWERTT